jgi:hypothetical protein
MLVSCTNDKCTVDNVWFSLDMIHQRHRLRYVSLLPTILISCIYVLFCFLKYTSHNFIVKLRIFCQSFEDENVEFLFEIYVDSAFGPDTGNHPVKHNDLFRRDPSKRVWLNVTSEAQGLFPPPRTGHGVLSVDGMLYVHGGEDGDHGELLSGLGTGYGEGCRLPSILLFSPPSFSLPPNKFTTQ